MTIIDLKQKIFNKVKAKKDKQLNRNKLKSGCLMFFVIFLIVFVFFAFVVVVKTGIVEVPVLSKVFYQKPHPTRTIKIIDLDNYQSEGKILASEDKSVIIIEATERDLTASLKSELAAAPNSYFGSDIQIAIFPEEIEFYSSLPAPSKVVITLVIKPEISNENFDFKITKTKIGSLKIHPKLVDVVVRWLMNRKTNGDFEEKLKTFFNKFANIQNFQMNDGMISLSVNMDIESLLQNIKPTEEQLKQLEEKYKDQLTK
jgi:hypothetical protein